MKGIICSMHKFDLSERETELDISAKPKLIIGAIGKFIYIYIIKLGQ